MSGHPTAMTMAQLMALPIVARLFKVEHQFVDTRGRAWDVGLVGGDWSKAKNTDDAVRLQRPNAAETARKRPA